MKNLTFGGLRGQGRGEGCPDFKNLKSLIENGGPNTHRKFQYFNSIRKYLKLGGTDWTFGGVKAPPRA